MAQDKDTEFILPEYRQKKKPAKRLFIESGDAHNQSQPAKRPRRRDVETEAPGPSGLNQPAAPVVAAKVAEPEWSVSAAIILWLLLLPL